ERVGAILGKQLAADGVLNERPVDVPIDVFAGRPRNIALPPEPDRRRTEAHLVVVELLGEEWDPPDAGLCEYQIQARVPLEHPGGDHVAHRLHAIPLVPGRSIRHEPAALLGGELHAPRPRMDVEVARHPQILAGGPEALVVLRAVEQVFRRYEADGRSPQAPRAAPLELPNRVLDVPQGDHRQAPEAL